MWEYKVVPLGDYVNLTSIEKELNRWGAEGWELVGLEPMRSNYGALAYLKLVIRVNGEPGSEAALPTDHTGRRAT